MAQPQGENDETSTTHHHSSLLAADTSDPESLEEVERCPDISLRIHKRVARVAAAAYSRVSMQSNALNQSKLEDIALVRFDELEIGELLGKGSFSNVHEITKVAASNRESISADDENSDDDPRNRLTSCYRRSQSGVYRYAIKFLRDDIMKIPDKYAIGTADLVIEGMFLASISHPNIIRVRGLPEGGVQSLMDRGTRGYFLVLDRLFDTLGERIYGKWVDEHSVPKKCFGLRAKPDRKHLAERLRVAFDISAALQFLHSKRIIYRDLKPENLGFDVRGDIKLFDLGLVKELHPDRKDKKGNYRLSMAGTPRYMAPECGMFLPYNLSADVYSFSMLLWEILTLEKPFKNYTFSRLKQDVFEDAYRPPIRKVRVPGMKSLISSGWHHNPTKRPSMENIYDRLQNAYQLMEQGEVPQARISHDRRRSTYVPTRITTTPVSQLVSVRELDVDN